MIPSTFDYLRADSSAAAVAALVEHGDEAKLLAGGHSLLPLMKLRLATPAVLVDIGRLEELSYIRIEGDEVAVGGLTRIRAIETSELLAREVPLLAHVAGAVGDPQVRNRGTIGGSIAHGDSASDLPAALLALGATLVVTGADGDRVIGIDDFFVGFLETALSETELLTEIRVPRVPDLGWGFQKFTRRAQDWAIVGCAATYGDGAARIGMVNMGTTPLRSSGTERALAEGASVAEAARAAAEGTEPPADIHGSTEYRRHLAQVLVRRALESAAAGAAPG